MVKNCPYCGEEQRALKNHVRLAAGDGHGPSGQYPDDFDQGPAQVSTTDDDDDDAGGAGTPALPDPGGPREPPTPNDEGGTVVEAVDDTGSSAPAAETASADQEEIVTMPEDEFADVLDGAYEAGQQDAQQTAVLEPVEEEEDDDDDDSDENPAFSAPESDESNVIDVEATPVDDSDDTDTADTGDSGGVTLGTVLMWIVVLPLLAAFAVAMFVLDPEDQQNQDPFGNPFDPGRQETVEIPGV